MTYNPLFGIGECTAQVNAFKLLWLQHRRINGELPENESFDRFYQYASRNCSMKILMSGKMTMRVDGSNDADHRYLPVDFSNLRWSGEDLYTWSKRMEYDYPWRDYIGAIRPEDISYIAPHVVKQDLAATASDLHI